MKVFKIIPHFLFIFKFRPKLYLIKKILYFLKIKFFSFLFIIRNFFLHKSIKVNKVDGVSFKLFPKGEGVLNYWANLKFKQAELEFLLDQIYPRMVLFDIGAGAGFSTIAMASKFKNLKIYAFEPYLDNFQILKKNIKINRLNNIIPYCSAVSCCTGKAILQISSNWENKLNTIGQLPYCLGYKIITKKRVPVVTLDNFIENNNIHRVDLIKIDVEGAELLAFQGAKKLLEKSNAPIIFYKSRTLNTQAFNYHPVEVMWFLEKMGYYLFELNKKIISRCFGKKYDVTIIAIKPNHRLFKFINSKI